MVNHLIEVLLQGVWSSFTGGWYYDPNATLLTNTVHMYIWLVLFSLPMSLYLIFEASVTLWSIYTVIIGLSFLIVKLTLLKLNRIFNKTPTTETEAPPTTPSDSHATHEETKTATTRPNDDSDNDIESETAEEADTDEPHYSIIDKYEKIEMIESLSCGTAISQEETLNEASKPFKSKSNISRKSESSSITATNDYEDFLAYKTAHTGSSSVNEILIDDRSLFKISEESIAGASGSHAPPNCSIPSFEDTSVSDTKLFTKKSDRSTKSSLRNRVRRTSSDLTVNEASRPFLTETSETATGDEPPPSPSGTENASISKSFNYLFPSRIDLNNNLNDELKEALEFLFNESAPTFDERPPPPPLPPPPAHRLRRQHPVAKKRSIRFENDSSTIESHNLDEIVVLEAASEPRPVRLAKRRRKLSSNSPNAPSRQKKRYVKTTLFGCVTMRLNFTRYQLAAMFDLSESGWLAALHVLLALLVCICASGVMSTPIYAHSELSMLLFAATVASCHYSLLKSVQPESSAQVHSFSHVSPLSRSIYFCIISSACLALNHVTSRYHQPIPSNLFGVETDLLALARLFQMTAQYLLLTMPLMFTLGIYGQFDTFAFALTEQIDIHVFGGTAMASLGHAISSLAKSLLCTGLLAIYHLVFISKEVQSTSIGYVSLLVSLSYLSSRQSSAHWSYMRLKCSKKLNSADNPMCASIGRHIWHRSRNDAIGLVLIITATVPMVLLASDIITNAAIITKYLYMASISLGVLNNYIIPSMRSEYPWLLFSKPFLKCDAWSQYEVNSVARLKWFERLHVLLNSLLIRNVLNVALLGLIALQCLSTPLITLPSAPPNIQSTINSILVSIFGLKLLRASFCQPGQQYQIYSLALIIHLSAPSNDLWTLYVLSIIIPKLHDIIDKLSFIFIYTAPWQLPWGSAFHAFAQPLSLPHSGFLLLQTFLSTLIGAPLMSLLGSSIFLVSYMRPLKFWPSSKSVSSSQNPSNPNTATSRTLTETPQFSFENNENLNAIFYEHLCTVLQKSLCGDLMLGRWGNVNPDDFFILSSDYLNCMVHVIEMGNGFCTFQLRGLEFKGTYCQQRELEAITEDLIGVNLETTCSCCAFQSNSASMRGLCASCTSAEAPSSPEAPSSGANSSPVISINRSSRSTQTRVTRTSRFVAMMRRCGPSLRTFASNLCVCVCCCCCVAMRHYFKFVLSLQNAFQLRWYAWRLVTKKYIVNSYRICDNDLSLIVNFFSLRRTLIDFYVRAAIYYAVESSELSNWLANEAIVAAINERYPSDCVDTDKCFDANLDSDYDYGLRGISHAKFCVNYLKWIEECVARRRQASAPTDEIDHSANSLLVRFLFALSLACKRALLSACNYGKLGSSMASTVPVIPRAPTTANTSSSSSSSSSSTSSSSSNSQPSGVNVDHESLSAFQHGLFTLFKGDVQIQSPKDDWVCNSIEVEVMALITSAVRMALRLHQDHFQFDHTDERALYDSVAKYAGESVIAHEHEPAWRRSILANVPSLLSLRHQFTEFSDQYKVIMLNRNFLSFRVIKLNKECVKSFWAGQQHELIFLKNKNQERGSIQNAKQVLRNIINSSCDQPIGYPIYVSPLITSYASSHEQLVGVVGGEMSFRRIDTCFRQFFKNFKMSLRSKGGGGCGATAASTVDASLNGDSSRVINVATADGLNVTAATTTTTIRDESVRVSSSSPGIELRTMNGSDGSVEKRKSFDRAVIVDVTRVLGDDSDVKCDEKLRSDLNRDLWNDWRPQNGMEGDVVLRMDDWTIVRFEDKYLVAIQDGGVEPALQHECTSL